KRFGAALEHIARGLQTPSASFGGIRGGFGVAEDESGYAVPESPPELKDRISADGDSDDWRTICASIIHHPGNVRRVLLHGCRAAAQRGFTVPPQIRHDQLVSGS